MSTTFKLPLTTLLSIIITASIFSKQDITMNKKDLQKAAITQFSIQQNKENNFSDFCKKNKDLIKDEHYTPIWLVLKGNDNTLSIIDFFPSNDARDQHFNAPFVTKIKDNAPALLEGGSWDKGAHRKNFDTLSVKLPTHSFTATEATFILLQAAPGQEKNVENLLIAAAEIVEKTEPKTLFWAGLKLDDNTYAIFDTFTDESGRKAHFEGKVAEALNKKAATLIKDGWDNGVLPNIHNYKIVTAK